MSSKDEFPGLKSKMYSLISLDDKEVTKAKGLHDMKRIQSKLHRIGNCL